MSKKAKKEFAAKLKKWRGNRLQKEAASLLQVPLRTYQGWEEGREAGGLAIVVINLRMEQHPEHRMQEAP